LCIIRDLHPFVPFAEAIYFSGNFSGKLPVYGANVENIERMDDTAKKYSEYQLSIYEVKFLRKFTSNPLYNTASVSVVLHSIT
jgi:hypothetical protein